MKILCCGDRNWTDRQLIYKVLSQYIDEKPTIIEGGASGADELSREVAKELGLNFIEVPAEWDKHGRSAGPMRNREMLEYKPDLVIAFHDDLSKSKGTKNMVGLAMKAKVLVRIISSRTGLRGA